jgi:hypothetical protein
MKTTVGQGFCLMLSLVLGFGSVLSYTDTYMAFAIDMPDAPATQEATTAGSDKGDGDQGDNNDDQEDDPVTQETITAGRESEDNDDDNSGQDDNNNNNNNDNKNETSGTGATGRPDCPKNQEPGLFGSCMPAQDCPDGLPSDFVIQETEHEPSNNCANTGSEAGVELDTPSTND